MTETMEVEQCEREKTSFDELDSKISILKQNLQDMIKDNDRYLDRIKIDGSDGDSEKSEDTKLSEAPKNIVQKAGMDIGYCIELTQVLTSQGLEVSKIL